MNHISKTNKVRLSTGEKISRMEFNKRIHDAKELKLSQQLNEHGLNFCQDCANDNESLFKLLIDGQKFINDLEYRILECSHEISVKECVESGRAELAYDLNNMRIRCHYHHKIKDELNLKFKQYENTSD